MTGYDGRDPRTTGNERKDAVRSVWDRIDDAFWSMSPSKFVFATLAWSALFTVLLAGLIIPAIIRAVYPQ